MTQVFIYKPWKIKDYKQEIRLEALETLKGISYLEYKYVSNRLFDHDIATKLDKLKNKDKLNDIIIL